GQSHRSAARLAADVRVAPAGFALARAPGRARLDLRAADRGDGRVGALDAERAGLSGSGGRWLCALDAVRVLAAPARVSLRTGAGIGCAPALDHPRRAPRPSQRSAAAGDASVRERAARGAAVRALLRGFRTPLRARRHGGLLLRLPGV